MSVLQTVIGEITFTEMNTSRSRSEMFLLESTRGGIAISHSVISFGFGSVLRNLYSAQTRIAQHHQSDQ